jgi:hypothetical protein
VTFEAYPRIARYAALDEAGPLLRALHSLADPPSQVATTFRQHHLAALVLATLEDAGVADELDARLLSAIQGARPHQPGADVLLATFDEMRRALSEAGVESVLLKGIYFAERLYGGYHRRPQFDLDVLVRAGHRRRAARVLRQLGYVRQTYDLHSQTFARGNAKADVHGWLRRAPAYRIDEAALWRDVRPVHLEHLDVLTLSDEFNLVLLGVSCFEDLGQGMMKLKQVLDVYLFLRQVDASMDWNGFFSRRAIERTDGIIASVFALVIVLFEACGELPALEAALGARRPLRHDATREQALALISSPRKHPANLTWFGRVYPGSLWHYLAWFWLAGFPENLKQLGSGRVLATMGAAHRPSRDLSPRVRPRPD